MSATARTSTSETAPRRSWTSLGWGLLALGFLALVASAWLHEDAYITFRVIDNFLDGRGLTWNPAERVQVYTHPLWLVLLTPLTALTGEFYFTTLALTAALTLATLYLVIFHLTRSLAVGCLAGFTLLLSKAFLDFATAGLENCLTRLLIALFVLRLLSVERERFGHLFQLALWSALGTLSRPDALLVFLPALGYLTLRTSREAPRGRSLRALGRSLGALALGFLPLALWGLFALFYYGSPFPNSAYAKLGLGVPRSWLLVQSGFYLLNSLLRDPVTLGVTLAAVVVTLRRPNPVAAALAAGGALYLAYVVWIGGDYMSGRLLAAPFFLSVLALAQYPADRWVRRQPVLALLLALVALAPRIGGPWVFEPTGKVDPRGIGDERRLYYPWTGLLYALGADPWPDHYFFAQGLATRNGPPVRVARWVGMFGFAAGPEMHVVDRYGITDPLLARLPAYVTGPWVERDTRNWRPGHGWRPLPEGYLESLERGVNRIADPDLARYYAVIRLVTRGELWSWRRVVTAVKLNLGFYDELRDAYVDRHRRRFTGTPPGTPTGPPQPSRRSPGTGAGTRRSPPPRAAPPG